MISWARSADSCSVGNEKTTQRVDGDFPATADIDFLTGNGIVSALAGVVTKYNDAPRICVKERQRRAWNVNKFDKLD
jgi:hypothetical protein